MRKLKSIIVVTILLTILVLSSCSTTRYDCRGKKHHRLSNGIYM